MKDGGPAFPGNGSQLEQSLQHPSRMVQVDSCPGMTLRQYYAGEAMKGVLASPSLVGGPKPYADEMILAVRQFSYKMADAMLKEPR